MQGRARDSCYFRQMIAGEPRDALRQWREVTRKLPLSPLLQGIIVMAEKKEISMLLACAICTQTVVVLKRHQQPAPVPIYQLTINKKTPVDNSKSSFWTFRPYLLSAPCLSPMNLLSSPAGIFVTFPFPPNHNLLLLTRDFFLNPLSLF